MIFSSTTFLFLFLPLTLAGYYLIDRRFKNYFLLAASLVFYAWGEPKFVLVMIGSVLVNHVFALLIDRQMALFERGGNFANKRRAKVLLCLMTAFNLSLFFVYKYVDFAIQNINTVGGLFGAEPLALRHIALPIGISFFTFQAMSYVFDVYYRRGRVQNNPLNTMLYVSLFPQLIAGPIVRYETVAEEIVNRRETIEDFAKSVRRFSVGLAKKVILANSLAVTADWAFGFSDLTQLSALGAWLGALAYSFQILFDFSGYSDMAIGLGLMFGFHFKENFDHPYISDSISEFWRRWHISLGSWFRDYVYIPLGGSRVKTKGRLISNLLVVWLLTGLWHGAAWHYVAWGLMYFALITFEKLTGYPQKFKSGGLRLLYRLGTMLSVMLGWVLFRAPGLRYGLKYIACMFGAMGNPASSALARFLLRDDLILFCIAILACVPIVPFFKKEVLKGREFHILRSVICLGLLLLSVSYVVNSAYDPFIYFNF